MPPSIPLTRKRNIHANSPSEEILINEKQRSAWTPQHHPSSKTMDAPEADLVNAAAENDNDGDADDEIAAAAEQAAQAVEAQDAISRQQQLEQQLQQHQSQQLNGSSSLRCCICGWGSEDGRQLLRFMPARRDTATITVAPTVTSFSEDIVLHVFCGKTASILPTVNRPDLEILTKAGIKNKHGIGPEVNGALARSRCATQHQEGAKEKQFYLVREVEAHLAAIRNVHISLLDVDTDGPGRPMVPTTYRVIAASNGHHRANSVPVSQNLATPTPTPAQTMIPPGPPTIPLLAGTNDVALPISPQFDQCLTAAHDATFPGYHAMPMPSRPAATMPQHQQAQIQPQSQVQAQTQAQQKVPPIKASAGHIHKPGIRGRADDLQPTDAALTEDGKVRCKCGGSHLPTGTSRGMSSYKSHIATKRHIKWMEANGLMHL